MRLRSIRTPFDARESVVGHSALVIRGDQRTKGLYPRDLRNRAGLRGENWRIGALLLGSPPVTKSIEV